MDPISQSKLKLVLEFGAIDDSTMQLTVENNNNISVIDPKKNLIVEHVIEISLPTEVTLVISGKNMMLDTKLDDTGHIIADKYVKLCDISLDDIPVPKAWLEKKIALKTNTQSIMSNYFGHNGKCTITFPKPNAFLQILSFSQELT